jgi:hypothetical protein
MMIFDPENHGRNGLLQTPDRKRRAQSDWLGIDANSGRDSESRALLVFRAGAPTQEDLIALAIE